MEGTFAKGLPESELKQDGSALRILIIHARWNIAIIEKLVQGAISRLVDGHKVKRENIILKSVPGSYELPFAAQKLLAESRKASSETTGDLISSSSEKISCASNQTVQPFDAVICIGVLIKGCTMHFEYISEAVTHGISRVSLDSGIPVIFGVLTCLNDEQALERAGENGHNHGLDWGSAAVEMALLKL